MQVHFSINYPFPGLHQVDVTDAREEWGLPDDTYDIRLIVYEPPHRVRFEILGGEHDGKTFEIQNTETTTKEA